MLMLHFHIIGNPDASEQILTKFWAEHRVLYYDPSHFLSVAKYFISTHISPSDSDMMMSD
jgi:hypothetical protein